MKTILFQGDSITDCHRYREATDNKQSSIALFSGGKLIKKVTAMGEGYPKLVSQELEKNVPGTYKFYNRGVSGDRIPGVYARIVKDIIKLKPDYMSLLVGVNDVWRNFDSEGTGTGTVRFEKVYNMLIEELKEEFPELKMIIMGPFLLHGIASDNRPDEPDRFEKFSSGVAEMADIAKKLAEKHGLKFVDLQAMFDEAVKTTPAIELTGDGVHPTLKGHELIKEEWLKAFSEITAGEIV